MEILKPKDTVYVQGFFRARIISIRNGEAHVFVYEGTRSGEIENHLYPVGLLTTERRGEFKPAIGLGIVC